MKRNRKSPRLKGYDYTTPGYYFITIRIKNTGITLGEIKKSNSFLNESGKKAEEIWKAIPQYYSHARLDEFIFMPDHMHGIIELSPLVVRTRLIASVQQGGQEERGSGGATGKSNPMLNPESLSNILRWYKGRSAFEIHKLPEGKLFQWHGRYYDRIIRNNDELNRIRYYIQQNPARWQQNQDEKNAA